MALSPPWLMISKSRSCRNGSGGHVLIEPGNRERGTVPSTPAHGRNATMVATLVVQMEKRRLGDVSPKGARGFHEEF